MKTFWKTALGLSMLAGGMQLRAQPFNLIEVERPRIMKKASRYLSETPETITATPCKRSKGGRHDFYSEGDYWWPNPEDPGGPYIRRDGETNPDNFVAHRHAMVQEEIFLAYGY